MDEVYYTMALASGVLRSHRQVIVAMREARWCIDGKPVDVLPGVAYSFARDEDADYFLKLHESERRGEPRAVPLAVSDGQVVVFGNAADAQWFISAGAVRPMAQSEVIELMQQAAGGVEAEHESEIVTQEVPPVGVAEQLPATEIEPASPRKKGGRKAAAVS